MGTMWLALVTGLTTGGVSCIAIQGGLLASSLTEVQSTNRTQKLRHVMFFLIAKILVYTILGMLLGYLGSFLLLSLKFQAYLQLIVGVYILGTAGKILDLHPVFRHFSIRPPKFSFKLAKKFGKNPNSITPFTMGALTVFMPCGVTQAMMLLAMSSGNPILGGAIMAMFTIGTTPIFLTVGAVAGELLTKKTFSYIAAVLLFYFGISSISGGVGLLGSPHTIQNYKAALQSVLSDNSALKEPDSNIPSISADGYQEVTILVENQGYKASANTLKAGIPVRLKLVTNGIFSCSRAFTIPSFNISKVLPETGEESIEFTPTKTGRLAYSCSMGMYTGSFQVVP